MKNKIKFLLGPLKVFVASVVFSCDRLSFMHTGGLGGYGSGDSEDERSDRGSESSDTDDEELRHRIRQKQEAFWRKEKEQQLLQDKQIEGNLRFA